MDVVVPNCLFRRFAELVDDWPFRDGDSENYLFRKVCASRRLQHAKG